jgi:type 1 fimbria pilin
MKNKNGLKLLWQLALALALSGTYSAAHAACVFTGGQGFRSMTSDLGSLGDVIVQRDSGLGQYLGSVRQPTLNGGIRYFTCNTGVAAVPSWRMSWVLGPILNNPIPSMSVAGMYYFYPTNITGIGIRFWTMTQTAGSTHPWSMDYASGDNPFPPTFQYDLFKTTAGPVGSGVLAIPGLAFTIRISDFNNTSSLDVGSAYFSGSTRVIQVKCSIRTPNIQVPLADVMVTDLTSPGMTAKPKQFDMGLDCDAGTQVNVKLTGTQNSSTGVNSVLQLTGAGSAGVASGVGIQLLYNNVPLELNKNILLKTSAGGLETFPFTAQYYQTAARVTGGTANTTATLEMTYQ